MFLSCNNYPVVNYKHLVIHNYTQFFILFSGKIHFAHRPKSMGEGGCDKNSSLENQELEGKLKARSWLNLTCEVTILVELHFCMTIKIRNSVEVWLLKSEFWRPAARTCRNASFIEPYL